MAEAHQATGVFLEHKRNVELLYSDDGIHIAFTIPPPWRLRQAIVRRYYHLSRAVRYRVYPAPPLAAIAIVAGVITIVLMSPSDSWWRSGPISELVWQVGNILIPFHDRIPHPLYIGYLAAWAGFIGLVVLMWCQRLILRGLLSYRGWLYLNPKEKSKTVLVWGALLKILGGREPLTYSFQEALPRQHVPPLQDTIDRYLESIHPLVSEEEYTKVAKMAQDFVKNDGRKFQFYLHLKSWWSTNYVTDWWEKYVYLRGRGSLMINSNYYALPESNLEMQLERTRDQVASAASTIYELMLFKQALDREELTPLLIRGIVPLCMSQYQRIFACTRIPGREEDVLQVGDSNCKHIAVLCRGRFFKMPLFKKGQRGRLLSRYEMQRQLDWIRATADELQEPVNEAEGRIAALTATGRIEWAETREKYFSEGINKNSLDLIEKAIFVVVLQDEEPTTWEEMGRSLIHGTGADRWFDKSFTLVAFKNGLVGLNAEHSWADAPVIAHMWEHNRTKNYSNQPFDDQGRVKCTSDEDAKSTLKHCKALPWKMTPGLETAISKAVVEAQGAIEEFDLAVVAHTAYGKGLIKKFGVSPDGFIQMALQLAYYRNAGTITQTYESSMTRLYRDGRTETVRPVTDASKAFVEGMNDSSKTKEERLTLLRTACDRHQDSYRNAMSGLGVDRHLFTLYCTSVGFGMESEFLGSALSRPWRLSTSQQPQQQTDNWKAVAKLMEGSKYTLSDGHSPGGGFGPVAKDGYGVSYMIAGEDHIFFHISSSKSCDATDSHQFSKDLFQAFADLKALW